MRPRAAHKLKERSMETTNAEGTLREVSGHVQEAVGGLLGDTGAQLSGKAKELGGKAQKLSADFAEIVRDTTAERPLMALGIAAAVGFVLGMLRAANRPGPDSVRRDRG
jgi:uncharacterized protein YjbJ (UPF0337 family)